MLGASRAGTLLAPKSPKHSRSSLIRPMAAAVQAWLATFLGALKTARQDRKTSLDK